MAETNLGGSVSAHSCVRDVKYSGSSSLRSLRYQGAYPTSEMPHGDVQEREEEGTHELATQQAGCLGWRL